MADLRGAAGFRALFRAVFLEAALRGATFFGAGLTRLRAALRAVDGEGLLARAVVFFFGFVDFFAAAFFFVAAILTSLDKGQPMMPVGQTPVQDAEKLILQLLRDAPGCAGPHLNPVHRAHG